MRILHVGFGFRPWIVTGLVIYSEAIMDGQVRQGHDVGYFFAARQLPFVRRPFLHRWRRRGVERFELVNSTVIVGRHRGTPAPGQDLDQPAAEATFAAVLARFRPDVVHFHDLGGLPSSLLEVAREHGFATVMTLHDYHPLCPTVKLYDARDRICLRLDPGEMCAVCCADAPSDNRDELAGTLAYARRRLRSAVPPLDALLRRPEAEALAGAGIRLMERGAGVRPAPDPPDAPGPRALSRTPRAPAEEYQRRRDTNLRRLNRVGALITGSHRSAQIYSELGVDERRIRVVAVNPPHIEGLRPKRSSAPCDPLRFVVLNAAHSTQKGADLLAATLALLSSRGLDHRFRLTIFGSVAAHVQPALASHPSVRLRGSYATHELDRLLEDGDVGLFPSLWEEVYGFVGLELLAKGIPVIGNEVGAIPEYVWPGRTGWLNRSGSATELADLMEAAINDPAEVQQLSESTVEARAELIRPFAHGLAAIEAAYRDVLAAGGPG